MLIFHNWDLSTCSLCAKLELIKSEPSNHFPHILPIKYDIYAFYFLRCACLVSFQKIATGGVVMSSLIWAYLAIHDLFPLDSMVTPVTGKQEISDVYSALKKPSSVAHRRARLLTLLSLMLCVWPLKR